MGKRSWGIVAGWLAAAAALVGAGVVVYAYWDSLLAAILSPIGGLVLKLLSGGKVVKTLLVVGFVVAAGAVAVRKKLRRAPDPEPAAVAAPPVYGPPVQGPPAPESGGEPVVEPSDGAENRT